MMRSIVVVLSALLAANAAHAANIRIERQETPTSPAVVSIEGRIDLSDYHAFVAVTQRVKKATVYFSSQQGRAVRDAVLIGLAIRQKRFNTAALDQKACVSACALAWLGGNKRFLGLLATLGFHAPFDRNTGERTPKTIAAVRIYLEQMGLSDRAASYVLEPGPKELNFIRHELDGKAHGIELTTRSMPEFVPLP